MSNIISLVPKGEKESAVPTEANENIVEILEDLLALAKEGKIQALAGAYGTDDEQSASYYYTPAPIKMLGALEVTKQYLIQHHIEL